MFDLAVPFFIPVWRRVAVLVVAFGWGVFEFSTGAVFWGMVFFAMGGLAAFQFHTADWAAVAADAEDTP